MVLQYPIGGATAHAHDPIAHLLAKLPLMSEGVWPDGGPRAMIWLNEQLHSLTIIYEELLAAPSVLRFDIHLLG